MEEKEVKETVEKMKAAALQHAGPPLGPAARDCYRELADGLRLCLTVDDLTREWIGMVAKAFGLNLTPAQVTGRKLWHLSIARVGRDLGKDEVEFWRRAFFKEPVWHQSGGVMPGVNSRHFFWEYR
jgi:hypothetical protein